MKKKDLAGTRKKTIEELRGLVEKKSAELAKVKVAMKAGQEKNLKKAKLIRHEISQLLSIYREKELIEKLEKETEKKEKDDVKKKTEKDKK